MRRRPPVSSPIGGSSFPEFIPPKRGIAAFSLSFVKDSTQTLDRLDSTLSSFLLLLEGTDLSQVSYLPSWA